MDESMHPAGVLYSLGSFSFRTRSPYDTIIYAHRHSFVPALRAKVQRALLGLMACRATIIEKDLASFSCFD